MARVSAELRPHAHRQVRRHYAALLLSQLAVVTALWPLTGHEGVYLPLSSLVGFALVERWQWWRRRDQYLARIEIGVALRASAEPRPHLRAAVDREAERVLQEHQQGLGVIFVLFGGSHWPSSALPCSATNPRRRCGRSRASWSGLSRSDTSLRNGTRRSVGSPEHQRRPRRPGRERSA